MAASACVMHQNVGADPPNVILVNALKVIFLIPSTLFLEALTTTKMDTTSLC